MRGGVMKKSLFKSFLMLAVFTAATIAISFTTTKAQSAEPLTINTTFDFYVGNEKLSAGKYTIKRLTAHSFVVRSEDRKVNVIAQVVSETGKATDSKIEKVVFNRYGERYFLAEIWNMRNSTGKAVGKSKTERQAEKETNNAKAKPQRIEVAVNVE